MHIFKSRIAYQKRMMSWTHLSMIQRRAITGSDWYQPRENILTTPNRQSLNGFNAGLGEHHVQKELNPFSSVALNDAQNYLMKHKTRAFLVFYQGNLVHSKYVNFDKDDTFNSMSLVKSIIGLCIGIAIDQRFITDIHQPACEFLTEWADDERRFITIEHLLTMQSGLLSDVSTKLSRPLLPIVPLYLRHNIRQLSLALHAIAPPEKRFVYNNYNSQALGIILERASGMTFTQFISKYLWQPLGLGGGFAWTDDTGLARTFGGFFARPIDWMRLGQLVLDKGRFNGQQIVPESWINAMKTPTNTVHRGIDHGKADYGYHLWLKAHDYGTIDGIPRLEGMYAKHAHIDDSMVYFEGMRGQYVFISPKHQLVMMRMGERPHFNWDASHAINCLCRDLA